MSIQMSSFGVHGAAAEPHRTVELVIVHFNRPDFKLTRAAVRDEAEETFQADMYVMLKKNIWGR